MLNVSHCQMYRNYLEENAVLEAVTKALSKMYVMTERPANPMEFIVKASLLTHSCLF